MSNEHERSRMRVVPDGEGGWFHASINMMEGAGGLEAYRERRPTKYPGGHVPPPRSTVKTDWRPGDAIKSGDLTGNVVGKREDGRFDVAWSNGVTTPMRPEKMSA